jgi:hypothetical protein
LEFEMKFSGETVMAYADGELDVHTRREIESVMPADPEVAQQITRHRALQSSLRATFAPVLTDPIPQRLIDATRHTGCSPAPSSTAWHQVHTILGWRVPAAAAVLALVVGVLLGRVLAAAPAPAITTAEGRMLADGALATALSEQPSGSQPLHSAVLVGLSYLGKGGTYCRTFTLKQSESIAGMACREADGWHVQALAQTGPKSPLTQYRMAGTAVPPLLLSTVESTIDGSPLDAEAEAAAREHNWQL